MERIPIKKNFKKKSVKKKKKKSQYWVNWTKTIENIKYGVNFKQTGPLFSFLIYHLENQSFKDVC